MALILLFPPTLVPGSQGVFFPQRITTTLRTYNDRHSTSYFFQPRDFHLPDRVRFPFQKSIPPFPSAFILVEMLLYLSIFISFADSSPNLIPSVVVLSRSAVLFPRTLPNSPPPPSLNSLELNADKPSSLLPYLITSIFFFSLLWVVMP